MWFVIEARATCRYNKRGVRGLFHGFTVTSFSGVTVNAVSITSYLYLRDKLMDQYNLDIRSAGAASGALTELLVAPFAIPSQVVSQVLATFRQRISWFLFLIFIPFQRVRIANLAPKGQSGFGMTLEVVKHIRKSEGYKGFYRGAMFFSNNTLTFDFYCIVYSRTLLFSCQLSPFIPSKIFITARAGTVASLWFNAPSQAIAWGSYEGFKILCVVMPIILPAICLSIACDSLLHQFQPRISYRGKLRITRSIVVALPFFVHCSSHFQYRQAVARPTNVICSLCRSILQHHHESSGYCSHSNSSIGPAVAGSGTRYARPHYYYCIVSFFLFCFVCIIHHVV
jgi:hypothetical protein